MKRRDIEKEIRENWFKNHVAEFTKLSDRVSTLSWGKPNSSFYYIRYVFDGSKLYVSGDAGEAIFSLTEKADLKSIQDYDVHYLHGKLSAYSDDEYSFDSEIATQRIKEEIKYANENKDYIDEDDEEIDNEYNRALNEHISHLTEIMLESKTCCTVSQWKYEIEQRYDDLSDYDCDIAEWIFSAGNVIPNSIHGYLIGLKMAYEQLNNVATV